MPTSACPCRDAWCNALLRFSSTAFGCTPPASKPRTLRMSPRDALSIRRCTSVVAVPTIARASFTPASSTAASSLDPLLPFVDRLSLGMGGRIDGGIDGGEKGCDCDSSGGSCVGAVCALPSAVAEEEGIGPSLVPPGRLAGASEAALLPMIAAGDSLGLAWLLDEAPDTSRARRSTCRPCRATSSPLRREASSACW